MFILKLVSRNKEVIIAADTLKIVTMEEAHKPLCGFKKTYECVNTKILWHDMYRDI